jgi:hypothetical protein
LALKVIQKWIIVSEWPQKDVFWRLYDYKEN